MACYASGFVLLAYTTALRFRLHGRLSAWANAIHFEMLAGASTGSSAIAIFLVVHAMLLCCLAGATRHVVCPGSCQLISDIHRWISLRRFGDQAPGAISAFSMHFDSFFFRYLLISGVLLVFLFVGPDRGRSSLIQLGYLVWILLLPFTPKKPGSWDVLRGTPLVWRLLALYGATVTVTILLWRRFECVNFPSVGLQLKLDDTGAERPSSYLIFHPLHVLITIMALCNAHMLEEHDVRNYEDPVIGPTVARRLTEIAVFVQFFLLVGAALLPPVSLDAFLFLFLFSVIVTIAQFSSNLGLLLAPLHAIGWLARVVLVVRSLLALASVHEWAMRLPMGSTIRHVIGLQSSARLDVVDEATMLAYRQFVTSLLLLVSQFLKSSISVFVQRLGRLGRAELHVEPGREVALMAVDRWCPGVLMIVFYTFTVVLDVPDVLTSLPLVLLVILLCLGRSWKLAGALLSVCCNLSLCAQYLCGLLFVDLDRNIVAYWGFRWSKARALRHFILLLCAVAQRAFHYRVSHYRQSSSGGGFGFLADADKRDEDASRSSFIVAYGAQAGAVMLTFLTVMRISFWSCPAMAAIVAFTMMGKASQPMVARRAQCWLQVFALCPAMTLLWITLTAVGMPDGDFMSMENVRNYFCEGVGRSTGAHDGVSADSLLFDTEGKICEDETVVGCTTQQKHCGEDWHRWLLLGKTSCVPEFLALLALGFLSRTARFGLTGLRRTQVMEGDAARMLPPPPPAPPDAPASPREDAEEEIAMVVESFDMVVESFEVDTEQGEADDSELQRQQIARFGAEDVSFLSKESRHDASSFAVAVSHCESANDIKREYNKLARNSTQPVNLMLYIYVGAACTWFLLLCAFLAQPFYSVVALVYAWLFKYSLFVAGRETLAHRPIDYLYRPIRRVRAFSVFAMALSVYFQCPGFPCAVRPPCTAVNELNRLERPCKFPFTIRGSRGRLQTFNTCIVGSIQSGSSVPFCQMKDTGDTVMYGMCSAWCHVEDGVTHDGRPVLSSEAGDYVSNDQCRKAESVKSAVDNTRPNAVLYRCLGLMKDGSFNANKSLNAIHLLIFIVCSVRLIFLRRNEAKILHSLQLTRAKYEFRARAYAERLAEQGQLRLSSFETKRQVQLSRLERLRNRLNDVSAIWEGRRRPFTVEEERQHRWAARLETISLQTGVQADVVAALLTEFSHALGEDLYDHNVGPNGHGAGDRSSAAGSVTAQAPALSPQLQASGFFKDEELSADKLCLDYIEEWRVRSIAELSTGEAAAARQEMLFRCALQKRKGTGGMIADGIRPWSVVGAGAASMISTPDADACDCCGGSFLADSRFANMALRYLCYCIDDLLFVSPSDGTLHDHRRYDSVAMLLVKAFMSRVLPLLVVASVLQFMHQRSILAAISTSSTVVACMCWPHVPWGFWLALWWYNSSVVFAKLAFQLQIFCADGTVHFSSTSGGCSQDLKSTPLILALGLSKASTRREGILPMMSSVVDMSDMLWSDILVCFFILLSMLVARYGGRTSWSSPYTAQTPVSSRRRRSLLWGPASADGSNAPVWRVKRPARDLYLPRFFVSLIILLVLLLDWKGLSGRGRSFAVAVQLSTNSFSGSQVIALCICIIIIVADRVSYTYQRNAPFTEEDWDDWREGGSDVDVERQMQSVIRRPSAPYRGATGRGFLSRSDNGYDSGGDEDSGICFCSEMGQAIFDSMTGETWQIIALVVQLVLSHAVLILQWRQTMVPGEDARSLLAWRHRSLACCYLLHMLYLVLTSLQLRYDLLHLRGGLRFTHKNTWFNQACFKVYMVLPFIHELRVLTDWTISKSSLNVFMWFKLEDAHNNLYRTKLEMDGREWPPPGIPRPLWEKALYGGGFIFVLLVVMIGPVWFFSSLNFMLVENLVYSGQLAVRLEVRSNKDGAVRVVDLFNSQFDEISTYSGYEHDEKLGDFMEQFRISANSHVSVQRVSVYASSDQFWLMSEVSRARMADLMLRTAEQAERSAKQNFSVSLEYTLSFDRNESARAFDSTKKEMNSTQLRQLATAFSVRLNESTSEQRSLFVEEFIPTMLYMSSAGADSAGAEVQRQHHHSKLGRYKKLRYDVKLELVPEGEMGLSYWKLTTFGSSSAAPCAKAQPSDECAVELDVGSDLSPKGTGGSSSRSSGGGGERFTVITIYMSVVLTIGKFLRMVFADSSKRIIYEELTDTSFISELCDGIYLARMQGNSMTEWNLYQELIRIYRSPELLAHVSNPKRLVAGYEAPLRDKALRRTPVHRKTETRDRGGSLRDRGNKRRTKHGV
eukprot:TRINITY_DN28719_c0_g1_i1.p1 TRINITY_DN28719_c0_g1~~TRINITY_DN28719_c0_g1_i1.p1  ORF type:complete len:2434 (-),score=419.29 TRINITY_DN28719_c0_g1_i1:49-6879(-)